MKKNYLILFLFCCFGHIGMTQSDSLINYKFQSIVPMGEHGLLPLMVDNSDDPSRIYIRHISNTDSVLAEKKIDLNRRGIRGRLEDVFYWQGKINVLSSLYYPGPKRNNLLITQYSLDGLREVGFKKIDEAYTPDLYRIPFGYSISPDSSKIAFYSWSYAIPEDPARLTIHVLDKNMRLLWQNYYLLPYKNETLYLYGCQLDNEGKFYLFCENYEGKVGSYTVINEKKIRRFVLLMEGGAKKDLRVYPLEVPEKVITDIRFEMDKQGNLIAAGFFREGNKRMQEGVFVFKIDGASLKISRKLVPISKEVYLSAYQNKKRTHLFNLPKSPFQGYLVNHLKIREDGTLFLIGEQQPQSSSYSSNGPVFGDILVVKLTPSYTMDWLTRIPKRQTGWLDNIYSYFYFERNGQHFFLFNDAIENTNYEEGARPLKVFVGKEPANVLVRITDEGEHTRRNISKVIAPNVSLWLYPSFCWPLQNKLIVYGESSQQTRMGGVFFEIAWAIFGGEKEVEN